MIKPLLFFITPMASSSVIVHHSVIVKDTFKSLNQLVNVKSLVKTLCWQMVAQV